MSQPAAPSLAHDAGKVCEFVASDGRPLKYRHWQAKQSPRAYVIALHGVQSHSGWYGYSSHRLAEADVDVRFLDRRGSGLNDADRGHLPCHQRLIDDITEFTDEVTVERQALTEPPPCFLLGLSWGARLATVVCQQHVDLFDGLILLYPGICTQIRPSRPQRTLLRMTRRIGAGQLRLPLPLAAHHFATDSVWQKFIREDPLALRRVSVSFLLESERLRDTAVEGLAGLTLPRLVMLAGQDEIVDTSETRDLLSQVPQARLSIIEYPKARHTLEFEPDREQFVDDLMKWIESNSR